MNDLVFISNNQVAVSSRKVAEVFKRDHKNVLVSIRQIVSAEKSANQFYRQTTYKFNNRTLPEYHMNRDGFMLLVMGFNTKDAIKLKAMFIKAFNEMEAKLKQEVASPVLDDYNRNIQRLMNENDDLKEKLKRYQRYAILGWSVEKLSKDDKTLRLASNFIEGCVNP